MPEDNFKCLCVTIILLDLVCKIRKKYYKQIFVEQYKCKEKKEIANFVPEEKEGSSSDDDSEKKNLNKRRDPSSI